MKKSKINLNLNKETIAKLNDSDLANLQGGAAIFSSRLFCDSGCERCTPISEIKPQGEETGCPKDPGVPAPKPKPGI